MKIRVLHNQSLLDIADMHTGTVLSAFAISVANGISLTDELEPGSELIIPDDVLTDADIQGYYKAKQVRPATAIQPGEGPEPLEGIGYWTIGRTFVVARQALNEKA